MAGKVFGVELDTLIQRQRTDLPKVVQHTIEYLNNKNGHLEEGLFRIPGNNIKITQLKKCYDTEANVDLYKHKDLDVHTVACLLKMYLRELPTPVIIPRYYSTYLKVYQNPDPKQRLINFRKLITGLPKSYGCLLLTVLAYLNQVAQNQSTNKMSTLNLALIFAPNLMRSEKETLTSIMEDADKVAGTLQLLIQEVEYLTTGKIPAWFAQSNSSPLVRTKSISSPPAPNSPKQQVRREDSISEVLLNTPLPEDNMEQHYPFTIPPQKDTNINVNSSSPPPSSSSPSTPSAEQPTTDPLFPVAAAAVSYIPPESQSVAALPVLSALPPTEAIAADLAAFAKEEQQQQQQQQQPQQEEQEQQQHATEPAGGNELEHKGEENNDIDDILPIIASQPDTGESDVEQSPSSDITTQQQTTQQQDNLSNNDSELANNTKITLAPAPHGSRPFLTTSLGSESVPALPKRRIRSLSHYWRSLSDTSLTLGNIKEPDEHVVTKSIKNMKALRASSDFTNLPKPAEKPRRRLSVMSFSSHQHLKSYLDM